MSAKPHLNLIVMGHVAHGKSTLTGHLLFDAGYIAMETINVSAKKGECEVAIGPGGQAREHAYLALTLGVRQLIVAINKMDDQTVKYGEERYKEARKELEGLLKTVGYDVSKINFIPTSGWLGDNLAKKSANTPWYKGPSILDALDAIIPPPKPLDKPLRVPIQDVYTITGVGTVPVGRVETGVLKDGDKVIFMPSGKLGEVKTIETHHVRMAKAEPGDNIGFNIRGVAKNEIGRGEVMGHTDNPPTVAKAFV